MTVEPHAGRGYMPQLDSLRFFAVLGVVVAHTWHPRGLPWLLQDLSVEWAALGVRLFFVLSGFLITGILLDCREAAERTSQSVLFFIRQFYVRRFLRIFPVYYLVIGMALVVDLPPARELWPWLTTYTSNVYITFAEDWMGRFGHFWTLAVEEQFYLVWPWVILFARRKWLVPIVLTAIPLAPIYRYFAFTHFPFDIGAMDFKAATLTVASLDTLGTGALLALLWRSGIRRETLHYYSSRLMLPAGVLVYFFVLALYHYRIHPQAFFTLADSASAMVFFWMVGAAALGFRGPVRSLLELKPFVYLGKISYGIYVFHNFTPLALIYLFDYFGMVYRVRTLSNFVLSGSLTVVVAVLSWELFERPINRLKRRFTYTPRLAATQVDTELSPVAIQN